MRRNEPAADRSIDLDSARPVAFAGGTAILVETYRTTSTGARIETGEVPVAVAGVWSPTDLKEALRACGFDSEAIGRAIEHDLSGESATRAVAIAEQQAGSAEILA